MMNKKTNIFVSLIFSFLISPVYGQVSDTSKNWTIQDCFQYAIVHNIQIKTLRLDQQSAEQDLLLSKAAKIPSLSATVGNNFNNGNNRPSDNGRLLNQLSSTGTYSVNSSIVLWNDHFINNNILQQNLLTQSAGLFVLQAQNSITLSISQAYLNILMAKENEKYISDLVNTTTASVKQGQMLYDAGSIAKTALLQLQAQLASDKYLLVQSQNIIRQDILSLKQLLQLPTDSAFNIVSPASIEVVNEIPALDQVEKMALETFPEMINGKLAIDIARLGIAMSKAAFKPVVKANGALGSGYNDVITNNVISKTGYFTQTGNNFYQNIGLSLSIPIFSQRINKTNFLKTKIAYEQANLNFQNNQLILSQSVEQAYLSTVNAHQAYEAANQQLISATESYRIANEELKLGAINTYDLLQLRNQYVQAVQAFTQAKYTAVLQQKIYEFYMGKPVTL